MRLALAGALNAVAASLAAGAAAAAGYHGQVQIDYRYTSGSALMPGSPADIQQTAHLVLTVANGRIRHLHGVVDFDYKWINTGCPDFTVETNGGGTVNVQAVGDGIAFVDSWNYSPPRHGRYVTPAPAVPNAPVTSKTTTPDNYCNAIRKTDRPSFDLFYVPMLSGHVTTPQKIVGSLIHTYRGNSDCHPFSPTPPPTYVDVSCTWRLRWTLTR